MGGTTSHLAGYDELCAGNAPPKLQGVVTLSKAKAGFLDYWITWIAALHLYFINNTITDIYFMCVVFLC